MRFFAFPVLWLRNEVSVKILILDGAFNIKPMDLKLYSKLLNKSLHHCVVEVSLDLWPVDAEMMSKFKSSNGFISLVSESMGFKLHKMILRERLESDLTSPYKSRLRVNKKRSIRSCPASVAQRQNVVLGIERSRVRNSLVSSGFPLDKEIKSLCLVAQFAGNAHWAEPSPLFAHRAPNY